MHRFNNNVGYHEYVKISSNIIVYIVGRKCNMFRKL